MACSSLNLTSTSNWESWSPDPPCGSVAPSTWALAKLGGASPVGDATSSAHEVVSFEGVKLFEAALSGEVIRSARDIMVVVGKKVVW